MPSPVTLPIAEYRPDLPDFPGQASANILNVYPRTSISYGAVNSPAALYDALGSRCQGGSAVRDSSGNVFLFAGDGTDLYNLKSGFISWTNVSKSPAAYSVPADESWQFAYFNGDVIAVEFADNPQVFTLASSATFEDLPGGPPRARYVGVVKNNFVVLGNTYDASNGNMPQRIWWSAAGDARLWPTPGTTDAAIVQSGATDLLGSGGWVTGIAPDLINADAVIFQEYAVRRMIYAGPPVVFDFLPAESARGCQAPDSIVVNGGIAYYWGIDGIYAFDGAASIPIGADKVDKSVFAELKLDFISRVNGVADPYNKLIIWAYPGAGSSGGVPNKLLIYNWQLQRFTIAEVESEILVRFMSLGYNLDELYTVFGYTIGGPMDVPAPLDSPIWTGGRLSLAMFDTDHKLNFFTGTPLAATVDTNEMEIAPGRRAFVRNARPLIDGSTPSVSIGHRDRLQDAPIYTTATILNDLGDCPQRTSGQYVRARTTVPASATWTNISGVELDFQPQGTR